MDDLVVIILTILVAVVGALSQRKKRLEKEAAKKTPGSQPNQPMDFWELLREQSTGQHPFDEAEPIVDFEEEEPVDVVPAQQPVYQFSAGNEGNSDIKESIMEEPQKKRHKVLIDGEKFSLRKAVIYSEIINRKYT